MPFPWLWWWSRYWLKWCGGDHVARDRVKMASALLYRCFEWCDGHVVEARHRMKMTSARLYCCFEWCWLGWGEDCWSTTHGELVQCCYVVTSLDAELTVCSVVEARHRMKMASARLYCCFEWCWLGWGEDCWSTTQGEDGFSAVSWPRMMLTRMRWRLLKHDTGWTGAMLLCRYFVVLIFNI